MVGLLEKAWDLSFCGPSIGEENSISKHTLVTKGAVLVRGDEEEGNTKKKKNGFRVLTTKEGGYDAVEKNGEVKEIGN